MKWLLLFISMAGLANCGKSEAEPQQDFIHQTDTVPQKQTEGAVQPTPLTASDVQLEKDYLFDKYLLEDEYDYNKTVRTLKWSVMSQCLAFIENIQDEPRKWGVFQNYKNQNREAPLIRHFVRNAYRRVSDTLGVERYQSVPLYLLTDTVTPERYGRDGTPVIIQEKVGSFYRVRPMQCSEDWYVPQRYMKPLKEGTLFRNVIFVDRGDQNIATLEWASRGRWKVRSTNPATTGRHRPPYAQETPLGIFVLQQKKERMFYLKDGSKAMGGFAPYASRFTNGAYIHGVPVNAPGKQMIEYSWSLGTIPRSHMCVRNATSHAKFIFDWAPTGESLVVVIE